MSFADVQPIFEPTDNLVPKPGSGQIDAEFSANPLRLAAAQALTETVPLRLLPIGRNRDQPAARQLSVLEAGHHWRSALLPVSQSLVW
jgi:hypothetical protein